MRLLNWLSRRRFPYEPLISLEVSRSRILHNLEAFRKLAPGGQVAPVLKANAYGHGLFEVAEILHTAPGVSLPFTVVDSYFEAVALRACGCRHPLLIIGYTRPETIVRSRLRHVAFTVTSIDTLRALHGEKPPAPEESSNSGNGDGGASLLRRRHRKVCIHLKIDTGMHRQGIAPGEVAEALEIITGNDSLFLEGICTHFSDADNSDESFTEGQINVWNRVVDQFKAVCPHLRYIHAANTDGSRFSRDIHSNVLRLGIGLYGLSADPAFAKDLDERPALEMKTLVTGIRQIPAGDTLGYGNTWKAVRDTTIATIPVGYYEGLDRRLSSGSGDTPRAYVLVGPRRVACPIIGRVSMNISIIDVTAAVATPEGAAVGADAIVMSREPGDPNTVNKLASACGTIPYEIIVKIPAQLKRVIVE